ncbi:MAG TPA: rRNA (cytidine-2'-O-)-methyltransferase, partial [Desulfosporosinus sp.]|nr:rRNA (cytidine-2'-O-)-methyltransferase [Desulfosporosinus sp.]
LSKKDAMKEVAKRYEVRKSEVYKALLYEEDQ